MKCSSKDHQVPECPRVGPGEASELLQAYARANPPRHQRQLALAETQRSTADDGTVQARIGDLTLKAALMDSGADESVVAAGVLAALAQRGVGARIANVDTPVELVPVGDKRIWVTRRAQFDAVTLLTSSGPLVLRELECWVLDEDHSLLLTIGRPVMRQLGYSTDVFLSNAYRRQPEWQLSRDHLLGAATDSKEPTTMVRVQQLRENVLYEREDSDAQDERAQLPDLRKSTTAAIREALHMRHREAVDCGLSVDEGQRLWQLLEQYHDIFRLEFGNDPPVQVPPLKVHVRPDAVPVKCKQRRYSPLHREYLRQHLDDLVAAGLLYPNHRSRWASPPRIVSKKEPGQYRMTVDTRGVNACTEPMHWPMPDLESAPACVEGSSAYLLLDWFRGYWQLPLAEESQELYTVMTDRGLYTPTRVLMGSADAVAYCQGTVQLIFGDLMDRCMLAWLDDILGFATTVTNLLDALAEVFARCARFGLKLHPLKCQFFVKEATWCGKVISANGVAHSSKRVAELVGIPTPTNAGDLQQLLCAVNWMRASIPCYSELTAPLYEILEAAMTSAGSRKKNKLLRVPLASVGWDERHDECVRKTKDALLCIVPLAHPRADHMVCLFTDASQDFWGACATQVPLLDAPKDPSEQDHVPLAFLSGKFTGAQLRWPIIEKEAYAIVESCKRLEYLLQRPGGFQLYTDHRNLIYIFNPLATDANMARYQVDKLQRWAMTLTTFTYSIQHVAGESNVWGDLLSRWGAEKPDVNEVTVRALAVVKRVSPLGDAEFQFPSEGEIRDVQRAAFDNGATTGFLTAWRSTMSANST